MRLGAVPGIGGSHNSQFYTIFRREAAENTKHDENGNVAVSPKKSLATHRRAGREKREPNTMGNVP